MKLLRFPLRDFFWLAVVVAVGLGWWLHVRRLDHQRHAFEVRAVRSEEMLDALGIRVHDDRTVHGTPADYWPARKAAERATAGLLAGKQEVQGLFFQASSLEGFQFADVVEVHVDPCNVGRIEIDLSLSGPDAKAGRMTLYLAEQPGKTWKVIGASPVR